MEASQGDVLLMQPTHPDDSQCSPVLGDGDYRQQQSRQVTVPSSNSQVNSEPCPACGDPMDLRTDDPVPCHKCNTMLCSYECFDEVGGCCYKCQTPYCKNCADTEGEREEYCLKERWICSSCKRLGKLTPKKRSSGQDTVIPATPSVEVKVSRTPPPAPMKARIKGGRLNHEQTDAARKLVFSSPEQTSKKKQKITEETELSDAESEEQHAQDLGMLSTQDLFSNKKRAEDEEEKAKRRKEMVQKVYQDREEEYDRNPPLTQRYFKPGYGPERTIKSSREEITLEPWRCTAGVQSGNEKEDIYRVPTASMTRYDHMGHQFVLPFCYECKDKSAMTVNANCGHSVWCIECSRKMFLMCPLCGVHLSRIIPILNCQYPAPQKTHEEDEGHDQE